MSVGECLPPYARAGQVGRLPGGLQVKRAGGQVRPRCEGHGAGAPWGGGGAGVLAQRHRFLVKLIYMSAS